MTLDPNFFVIKSEKKKRGGGLNFSCWSLAHVKDTQWVHACKSFVHGEYIYLYFYISVHVYVYALQVEGELLLNERWGRICQFQAGLEMDTGDGEKPEEVSTTTTMC